MGRINLRPHISGLVMLWALALAMMSGAISNAVAQTDLTDQIAKADLGYGEYLAGECVTCHRKSGAEQPMKNQ